MHHRTEATLLDGDPPFREPRANGFVELVGPFGGLGAGERRPTALPHIAEEGELGYDEDRTADVLDGARHLALFISKYPEPSYLVGQVRDFGVTITAPRPEIHEQPLADGTDDLSIDSDDSFRNPLSDGSHPGRVSPLTNAAKAAKSCRLHS